MSRRAASSAAIAVAVSILLLAMVCISPAIAKDEIVCARCGNPVRSGYAEAGGRFYHAEHFLCAVCDKPIADVFLLHEGEPYHEGCFKEHRLARCARCNRPIETGYVVHEGKSYHEECFAPIRPACAVCGRDLTHEFVTHEGKQYHPSCYEGHVAPRCALCNGIIEGGHLKDYWKNLYHEYHQDEVPRCEYCSRLIAPRVTGGGVEYADGRHVCRICLKTAVKDPDAALEILMEVAGILSENGMEVDVGAIQLYLTSRDDIAKLVGRAKHVQGHTEFRTQQIVGPGGAWKKRSIAVRILIGMPAIDAIATIAHELAHVWRFTRNERELDAAFEEGSCNYAAYLVLGYYPGERADYFVHSLMNDPDSAYGEGFRRVKNLVDSRGKEAWLDQLATGTKLPRGF